LRRLLRWQDVAGLLFLGFSARLNHERRQRQRQQGFNLRHAVADLRGRRGLAGLETVRHEGAPIPLKPMRRWDNGRDVVVVGDAAGVVAPASGEGIYYAMACARFAAEAVEQVLATGQRKFLATAARNS